MLYTFAFANISGQVVSKLTDTTGNTILRPSTINQYIEELVLKQPQYILGLGEYSGKDQNLIRIETECKNQFRNNQIDPSLPIETTLTWKAFLAKNDKSKKGAALGNSWCNLVSWRIMQLIESKKLQSHYTFLHLPQSLPEEQLIETVQNLINSAKADTDHFQK